MPSPDYNKRARGQYFTVGNPFVLDPFIQWFGSIDPPQRLALEPFAGACDIPALMKQAGFDLDWACFDIDPPVIPGLPVKRRDTIARFPSGFSLAITNPPYLARNSATRRGLPWSGAAHEDLYLHALEKMLTRVEYVAAIIPESFITRSNPNPRLHVVVSLPWRMFSDTDHPVCLALFNASACLHPEGHAIFSANKLLGRRRQLEDSLPTQAPQHAWVFNDPKGAIALRAVDNSRGPSIMFQPGRMIEPSCVKRTSRALTRISGVSARKAPHVIDRANELLAQYRATTCDVFMTSFKGLRADGQYRRRLDYATARSLLNQALLDTAR